MSRWLSAIAVAISLSGSAIANFPPPVADDELAQRPIIVVAHWDKAPMVPVDFVDGLRAKSGERTTLVVTRVIAGDLKPGRHEVIVGPFIMWSETDPTIMSGTSSLIVTDLDAGQPNIWFLQRGRRIKGDGREYLFLDNFRGVQKTGTEPYFLALRSKDPGVEVPKLLSSKDNEVVGLALDWICGGQIPWHRFEDDLPLRPYRPSGPTLKPRIGSLDAVEVLLQHNDPEIRRAAVCVVGEFRGKASLPQLRRSLNDPAPDVRAMAVTMLAALDDRESGEAINMAVRGINENAGEMICELAVWKNPAVVPALIGYLEDDGEGIYGEGFEVRCLLAQAALKQVTGHTFPLDIDVATRIWRPASKFADAGRREAFLTQALLVEPLPLSAKLIRDDAEFAVVVTNTSPRPVSLAKTPQSIDLSYDIKLPNGSRSGGIGGNFEEIEIDGKESFVELASGESMQFPYSIRDKEDFNLAGPGSREMKLDYKRNGHEYGLKAWVGTIKASTDSIESAK